ncbi:MAG: hypothetical protein IEMM0008_1064 [bacterium]|nr:MAG: hypothetical protein IEMM0008_1064 [bacterium]
MINLTLPISEEDIIKLKVGDNVSLTGIMVTARDVAHKYIMEHFIKKEPTGKDKELFDLLYKYLHDGIIYHCGPVVKEDKGKYTFLAAGPTTSIREEPYQADVMKHFGLRGVIGKGGMGDKTLQALMDHKAVYLHAIGGAAALIGKSVKEVLGVERLDFGMPEAFWIIRVEDFRCVVTMDSHGHSRHKDMIESSKGRLDELLAQ